MEKTKLNIFISALLIIICLQIFFGVYIYCINNNDIDFNSILNTVLTVNGLFSAILITYFFNNISWVKQLKLEDYNKAEHISQKITNFRRILNTLTQYYNVWRDDSKAKSLLEHNNNFKNIDYYDFRLNSISNYSPANISNIRSLINHPKFSVDTEAYLSAISLVYDRSNDRLWFSLDDLYGDYERSGVYDIKYIQNAIYVEHCELLSTYFRNNNLINFHNLSSESINYIKNCASKISTKYENQGVDKDLISAICEDMGEFYFKELNDLLKNLEKGLGNLQNLLLKLIFVSIIFGVILPFTCLILQDNSLKKMLSSIVVSTNISVLFFFILNFKNMIHQEIIWK